MHSRSEDKKSHKNHFRGTTIKNHNRRWEIDLFGARGQCSFLLYYDTNLCQFCDGLEHTRQPEAVFQSFLGRLPEYLAIHGTVKPVTLSFHLRSIAVRESQSRSFNQIFLLPIDRCNHISTLNSRFQKLFTVQVKLSFLRISP